MKWITKEQVKEAAKDKMTALKCSLKHHQQGRDATSLELQNAVDNKKYKLTTEGCACCQFNKRKASTYDCASCLVSGESKKMRDCCSGLWEIADEMFDEFKADPSNANHKAFTDAESKVCDYIEAAINKEKAKIAEESKPKYGIGDIIDTGQPTIYINTVGFVGKEQCLTGDCGQILKHLSWNVDKGTKLGNLKEVVDDLTALQENVTEFEATATGHERSTGTVEVGSAIAPKGLVYLSIDANAGDSMVHFTEDEFERFTLSCRKKLATMKRAEAKK